MCGFRGKDRSSPFRSRAASRMSSATKAITERCARGSTFRPMSATRSTLPRRHHEIRESAPTRTPLNSAAPATTLTTSPQIKYTATNSPEEAGRSPANRRGRGSPLSTAGCSRRLGDDGAVRLPGGGGAPGGAAAGVARSFRCPQNKCRLPSAHNASRSDLTALRLWQRAPGPLRLNHDPHLVHLPLHYLLPNGIEGVQEQAPRPA